MRTPAGGEASEVVVLLESPPLARAPGNGAEIAAEQAAFRRELARRRSGREDRLAVSARRQRVLAHASGGRPPPSPIPAGGPQDPPRGRELRAAGRVHRGADRRTRALGPDARHGRPGDEDRDHRLRGRPGSPVLRPDRLLHAAGVPEGAGALHDGEGHRRSRLRTEGSRPRRARASRSTPTTRAMARTSRGSRPETPTPWPAGRRISGVAPRAYIGNYKVFVETSSGLSPNANAPAIVAAIEAAVRDGMDVINFSGGEPEIEPSRDVVALALDAAAAAGVVPVVAAGNDYDDVGAGSVSSPANSARAIAVGAVGRSAGAQAARTHADFSSVGPTTISLRLKPDVSAPGVDVLSSVSGRRLGGALRDEHGRAARRGRRGAPPSAPSRLDVEQVKSALVQTGVDATVEAEPSRGPPLPGRRRRRARTGGSTAPLRRARPRSRSGSSRAGASRPGRSPSTTREAAPGRGDVSRVLDDAPGGVEVGLPATVAVPGELPVSVAVGADARVGRPRRVRGAPPWRRRAAGARSGAASPRRRSPGTGRSLSSGPACTAATTRGQPAFVSRYRYPETPRGIGVTTTLRGPERVFRLESQKRVANFGVVVTRRGPGSHVEPRIVAGLDENRLTGYAGLPVNHNPYIGSVPRTACSPPEPSPPPRATTRSSSTARRVPEPGAFTFRYWVNDVTPPTLRLAHAARATAGAPCSWSRPTPARASIRESIQASVDGSSSERGSTTASSRSPRAALAPGTHRLRLRVSDYQETKNTENVGPILPNTRGLTATFSAESVTTVRRCDPAAKRPASGSSRSESALAVRSAPVRSFGRAPRSSGARRGRAGRSG